MLPVPKLLLFVCELGKRAILGQTLATYAQLTWVCNMKEMTQQLKETPYDVVFCADALCTGTWRDVLEEVRQFNPELPVVVLSETADEQEWEEVLAAGAFDLLSPPSYDRELLPVVEQAVASYEARVRCMSPGPQWAKAS